VHGIQPHRSRRPAEQWDDRQVDVRSISAAAGLNYQNSPVGLRVYEAEPGEQLPVGYHYHDAQVEAFYVLEGTLNVETPGEEFCVGTDQAFIVEPGNPHRAYNAADSSENVRVQLWEHRPSTMRTRMIQMRHQSRKTVTRRRAELEIRLNSRMT